MKYLKTHYEWQLKQMKPKLEEEIQKYLKDRGEKIIKVFNNEMRRLVLHFQDYRIQMEGTLDHNFQLSKHIVEAEKLLASQASVNEGLFGTHPKTPLSLYNCLIPRVAKQPNRMVPNYLEHKEKQEDVTFFMLQANTLKIELDKKEEDFAKLRDENIQLQAQIDSLKD